MPPRPHPPRASSDPDRITPREAAALTHLGYSEEFTIVRWSLEEAFDPASLVAIPVPDEFRVALLTTSQERQLEPGALSAYRHVKASRQAWVRAHWMRVPAWGGRKAPGGEYRYSAARCHAWHTGSLG